MPSETILQEFIYRDFFSGDSIKTNLFSKLPNSFKGIDEGNCATVADSDVKKVQGSKGVHMV